MVRVSFLGTVVLMAGGFRATCDLCFLGNGVWELLAEKKLALGGGISLHFCHGTVKNDKKIHRP